MVGFERGISHEPRFFTQKAPRARVHLAMVAGFEVGRETVETGGSVAAAPGTTITPHHHQQIAARCPLSLSDPPGDPCGPGKPVWKRCRRDKRGHRLVVEAIATRTRGHLALAAEPRRANHRARCRSMKPHPAGRPTPPIATESRMEGWAGVVCNGDAVGWWWGARPSISSYWSSVAATNAPARCGSVAREIAAPPDPV